MSQIGLKALKVLGGAERPTENTAQLSEAWLKKIQKINQVADNMDNNNGVVKTKKSQPTKSAPMMEQKERQVPITEILARTKSDKIGLNKKQVSSDDIQALLSGNRSQVQQKVPTRNVETQYEQFIKESKEVTQPKPTQRYEEPINNDNRTILKEELGKIKRSIRGLVNEEVNSILFNEIFSEDRLKILIENVFRDVIEKRAKEILMETLKRKKSQSE
jgi:hypothetical protein